MNTNKVYSPGILDELVNKSIQFHNALLEKDKVNEDIISEILSETNNEKRQIIRNNYKKIFKHPIQDDINKQLTENNYLLHDIAINMFDTPYEFEARELKKALSTTIGGDEDIIIEIFASRPKSHLNMIDLAYEKFYKISLKEDIKNKLSQDYSKFLLTLMESDRPEEQTISKEDAYNFAKDLINNGIKQYTIDVNLFKNIFVEKSRKDLILIARAYYELHQKCLYDDIVEESVFQKSLFDDQEEDKKVRNKIIRLIKGLLFATITPAQFFSQKCSHALTGFTSDINTLLRVLILRSEIDINVIRDYYFKETNNDIMTDIKKEYNCRNNSNLSKILTNLFK
jgi:hypothetical protein